jgi:molecular chaperone GrpE
MSKNKQGSEFHKDKHKEHEHDVENEECCHCECERCEDEKCEECEECKECKECLDCKKLTEELEKEKQLKLMALADLINYRKRVDKEREEMHTQANRRILLHIIDVIDDLYRAMENEKENNVMSMLLNKLGTILKDYSLEEIKCDKGDVFNPEVMEAITAVNAKKDDEKNKVVDIISRGYRNSVNGQVFKSVKVIIAR